MSVEDAIAAAQSFSSAIDQRFAAERAAIEAKAAEAKEKLASGVLDLKTRSEPAAPPAPAVPPTLDGGFDASAGPVDESFDVFADAGTPSEDFLSPLDDGGDRSPFSFDDVPTGMPAAAPAEARGAVSFDDFNAVPEPELSAPLGGDELVLDDDGIPTWQDP